MSDNKILDAVRQLDPTNDNHWTTDGLPRLETVRMLAGDASISRDAVEAAAPGFNKASAKEQALQGNGAQGNGAGTDGVVVVPTNPPTAPSTESLRGTDNDTLREQASEPGTHNLNAEGGPSDGPSVPDEVQAAAATPVGTTAPLPPEITHGSTMQGFNALATPASDAYDAAITTSHGATTPPALGGPGDVAAREAGDPAGQTAEQPTDQGTVVAEGQAKLSPVEHGTDGDPDAVEALEAELEEASARNAKLRGYADEIAIELHTGTQNEARIRNLLDAARPRSGTMPAIQAYFGSQDKTIDDAAAARKAITDSGLDLKALQKLMGPAPVDAASSKANEA